MVSLMKSPFLRSALTAVIVSALALLPLDAFAGQERGRNAVRQKRLTGEQIEWFVFDLINAERRKAGLGDVKWDPDLLIIARQHSERLARLGALTHLNEGKTLGERLKESGFRGWTAVGENLGQNRGHSNPAKAIVEKWLGSQEHRKNILDPRWEVTAVGVGIDRRGQVYFTQAFVTFRR